MLTKEALYAEHKLKGVHLIGTLAAFRAMTKTSCIYGAVLAMVGISICLMLAWSLAYSTERRNVDFLSDVRSAGHTDGGLNIDVESAMYANDGSATNIKNKSITLNDVTTEVQNTETSVNINAEVAQQITSRITSNADNWIILLIVNDGYIDFFFNWLTFYDHLNLNVPVYVVTEDDTSYIKLQNLTQEYLMISRSTFVSVKEAQDYKTAMFNVITFRKPTHILEHLQKGRNVLFIDVDALMLRNPFEYFTGDFDMWIQKDLSTRTPTYCTGFIATKANLRTIEFMRKWIYIMSKYNRHNDQMFFNTVILKNKRLVKKLGLDFARFPDGAAYFETFTPEERSHAVVVHNNFQVGHDKKKERFKKFDLWRVD